MTSRFPGRPAPFLAALVLFAALPSVPFAAGPEPEASSAPLAGDPGTGALYARTADGLIPLPTLGIDAEIRVTGLLVQGTVRQTFRNTSGSTIEALYVFPLPERATVDAFEMRVGDRVVRSQVRERETARAAYEAAKQEGRKAALVEFARKGLFRTSIAGILPDEEVAVTLRYFDEAEVRDGVFTFTLPLTWTSRYQSGADRPDDGPGTTAEASTRLPAERTCGRDETFVPASSRLAPSVEVRVALEAGQPLGVVRSGSHLIRVEGDAHTGSIQVSTNAGVPADRDFRLEWTLASAARPRGSIFIEEGEDGAYGLVMIVPPDAEVAADEGLSTATLFVVDVSGSMEGTSLDQAKRALLLALDELRPGDSFNLLMFSHWSAPFSAEFQTATPSHLDEARGWIGALHAGGGTEILGALRHAQALVETAPGRGTRRVILVTDGAADASEEAIAAIARSFGGVRLHTVGIGPAPNQSLLRALARRGRGACEFIGGIDEVARKLGGFLDRLRRPVLTDLSIDWDGPPPLDVRPELLPDLYAGEPLVLSFRAPTGPFPDGVTLRGVTASGPFSARVAIAGDAPRGAGLGARWARARIEDLLDRLNAGAAEDDVRGAVVPLALEFGLVTPYTSRVAIEERITYNGATPVTAANAIPGSAGDAITLPGTGTLESLWLRCGLLLIAAGLALVGFVRWFA